MVPSLLVELVADMTRITAIRRPSRKIRRFFARRIIGFVDSGRFSMISLRRIISCKNVPGAYKCKYSHVQDECVGRVKQAEKPNPKEDLIGN